MCCFLFHYRLDVFLEQQHVPCVFQVAWRSHAYLLSLTSALSCAFHITAEMLFIFHSHQTASPFRGKCSFGWKISNARQPRIDQHCWLDKLNHAGHVLQRSSRWTVWSWKISQARMWLQWKGTCLLKMLSNSVNLKLPSVVCKLWEWIEEKVPQKNAWRKTNENSCLVVRARNHRFAEQKNKLWQGVAFSSK